MEKKEILLRLKQKLLSCECSLESLISELDLNELEVFGFINELRASGENISIIRRKDGIYIENFGDIKSLSNN